MGDRRTSSEDPAAKGGAKEMTLSVGRHDSKGPVMPAIDLADEERRQKRNAALYSKPSEFNNLREDVGDVDDPGPGQYFGPESAGFNALGDQRFSKNKSAPHVSIPHTSWDNWGKVFVTKGHVAGQRGRDAPGVGTYRREERQLSELNTNTGRRIGKSQRPGMEKSLGIDPYGSPGPTYDIRTRHHKIMNTTGAAESIRFGKQDRWKDTAPGARSNLGPGQYSRKDTAIRLDPAIGRSFACGWASVKKQHPGPGYEQKGFEGSGPGDPLWKDQGDGKGFKKNGEKAHYIPKEKRFKMQEMLQSSTPGPGAYDRSERDVSNKSCFISGMKSASACSFGKPAKKARFRQRMAALCPHGMWGYF